MTTITIKRERINAKQRHDRPRKSKQTAAITRKKTFAMMPRALTQNPAQYDLGVIEFALLAGLIRGATEQRHAELDAVASIGGDRALVRHQQRHGRKYDERAKEARKRGYHKRMARLKEEQAIPETVCFELTPSALLQHAGMSPSAWNIDRIDDALARLRRPIIDGMPPPLLTTPRLLLNSKVRITVNGAWITPPTVRMPLPLPTKSAPALRLLLFLQACSPGGSIGLGKLCDWIGIAPCTPYEQKRRLKNAVWALKILPDSFMRIEGGRVYFGCEQ